MYCPDVYKSIYIRKINESVTGVGFCCQNSIIETNNQNVNDILQSKRQQYLENKHDPQCSSCWRVEKLGAKSRRHASIEWFENNDVLLDDKVELTSLDYNCDNVCNLACISCGPIYSSRWAAEVKNFSWNDTIQSDYRTAKKNSTIEFLDLSKIKRVYFNGGEPLLTNDHIDVLSKIEKNGRLGECEISYNTNGTQSLSQQCLDLWKQAKLVRICISIDAINEAFEYIRYPAKWQDITRFIDTLFLLDFNVIVDITCTVGVHNIFELPELIQWYFDSCHSNSQGDPVSLNLQPVGGISHGGQALDLENLSQSLAAMAINRVTEYTDVLPSVDQFVRMLDKANGDNSIWLEYLNQLDARRKNSWKQSLKNLNQAVNKSYSSGI
jgi:hypothetical protein